MASNSENNSNTSNNNNNETELNIKKEQGSPDEHPDSFNFKQIDRRSMSPETTRLLSLDPFSHNDSNLNNIDQNESELEANRTERNNDNIASSPDFNRNQSNKRDFANINDPSNKAEIISARKTPPNFKMLTTAEMERRLIEPELPTQKDYELFGSEVSQLSVYNEVVIDEPGPTFQFQPNAKRVKTQGDFDDDSEFEIPTFITEKDVSISQNLTGSEMNINPNTQRDRDLNDSSITNNDESNINESSNNDDYRASYESLHQSIDHIKSNEFNRRESVPMDFTLDSSYLPGANKRLSLEQRKSIPIDNNPFSSFSLYQNSQTLDQSQLTRPHSITEKVEIIHQSLDSSTQIESIQQNIESSSFNQSHNFNLTIPELSGKDTQDSSTNIDSHNTDPHSLGTDSQNIYTDKSSTQFKDNQENISVTPSLLTHYESQYPLRVSFGSVGFGINTSLTDIHSSKGVSRLGFGFGPNTQSLDFQSNEGNHDEQQSTSIHINQEFITEIDTSTNVNLPLTSHGFEKDSNSTKIKSNIDGNEEIIDSGDRLNSSSKSINLNVSNHSTPNSKNLSSTKSTPSKLSNEGNLSQITSPSRLNFVQESVNINYSNRKIIQTENLSFSKLKSPQKSSEKGDIEEGPTNGLHSNNQSINTPSPKHLAHHSASQSLHTPSPIRLSPHLGDSLSKRATPLKITPEKLLNQVLTSNHIESATKSKIISPLQNQEIKSEGQLSERLLDSRINLEKSPSRYNSPNVLNSSSKSINNNSPKSQIIQPENSSFGSGHTPSKQNNGEITINQGISPQRFLSDQKSINLESANNSIIFNNDNNVSKLVTPSVSKIIIPRNDDNLLPNEIIFEQNSPDKGTPNHEQLETNILPSATKSTPLKPHYENNLTNSNLDDDLFQDTASMTSLMKYTSQHQLDEGEVDDFLVESGGSITDLAQFLNRDYMPKLSLEQFFEAIGLDTNNPTYFEELKEDNINESELNQVEFNNEGFDDKIQENTELVQYILSNLKTQQLQFYENLCKTLQSKLDHAYSLCGIFENDLKSTGSMVIHDYVNMLERERPEFEKSIRANFNQIKNNQLEEFLKSMEDGLNQYESKLLDLIPVLDKDIRNLEDYSFIITQINEKLEGHFDELTKQLKVEELENLDVEVYKSKIADCKVSVQGDIFKESELSIKNNELSERLDMLKGKLEEIENEEKNLQSQVTRLGPLFKGHLFSKREHFKLKSSYKELVSETLIEPKMISQIDLIFLLGNQVEISLANPNSKGLNYESLKLKLIKFETEEQKEILEKFLPRLEIYIKTNKNQLELKGLLKFISSIWHQFHLILEKLSRPELESIAQLEFYPLEYYSVTSSDPIYFLQTTLSVSNDIGVETRKEIVVTNKFTTGDMLKFPNCLGTAKAEKTSGNIKDYQMIEIKTNLKFYKKFDPISIMYDCQSVVQLLDLSKDRAKVKSPQKPVPFRYSFMGPIRSEEEEIKFQLERFKNKKKDPTTKELIENLPILKSEDCPSFLHTFKSYLIRKGIYEEFMGYKKK